MVIPPYLNKGDKIALIAPARKMTPEELQPAIQMLGERGFEVVPGKHIFETYHQFAGTDAQRLEDLQWAMDHAEFKAVLAIRGGYGCLRLVDQVDFTGFMRSPKWMIGYSDLTVLHSAIQVETNVCTLHATMPVNFHKDTSATESLFNAIGGKGNTYTFSGEVFRSGAVKGEIVGGNLSLLYAMLGSETDISTSGKILFIEDLDEYLYHIDRMMLGLKRAGKLSELKALVVGGFSEMKDNAVPFGQSAHEIISNAVKEFDYPVFFDFPAGHQDANHAIILGAECSLEVSSGKIIFKQS